MEVFEVHPVGKIRSNGEGAFIELQKEYVQVADTSQSYSADYV